MIKSVTKSNPCPICGKTDWCGIFDSKDNSGGKLRVCQRSTENFSINTDGVLGTDGLYYVYVGRSKGGANIFEEANQRLAKMQQKTKSEFHTISIKEHKPKVLTPVDIINPLPDDKLNAIYRRMLQLLILEDKHREYLHKEGWSDDLIDQNFIRSFPEEDYVRYEKRTSSSNIWRYELAQKLVQEFGSLAGVPGAYMTKRGKWNFTGKSGILFPQFNVNHELYRLRLRLENVSSKKYRNFSSWMQDDEAEKQGFLINKYHLGCQAGNNLGFYFNESRDDMYLAYITEGEKKGIFSNSILRSPFVSLPGVNSYAKLVNGPIGSRPIDILAQKGVKIFVIAFDADKKINLKVLDSEQKTIEILKNEGFMIGIAEWDAGHGKGIDDLLANKHRPEYSLI